VLENLLRAPPLKQLPVRIRLLSHQPAVGCALSFYLQITFSSLFCLLLLPLLFNMQQQPAVGIALLPAGCFFSSLDELHCFLSIIFSGSKFLHSNDDYLL